MKEYKDRWTKPLVNEGTTEDVKDYGPNYNCDHCGYAKETEEETCPGCWGEILSGIEFKDRSDF